MVLVALPTALVVVLAFTQLLDAHALFYIDSQGVYRRGAHMFSTSLATAGLYIRPCMPLFRLEKVESLQKEAFIAPSPFLRFPLWWAVPSRFCFRYRAFVLSVLSILLLYIIYQGS